MKLILKSSICFFLTTHLTVNNARGFAPDSLTKIASIVSLSNRLDSDEDLILKSNNRKSLPTTQLFSSKLDKDTAPTLPLFQTKDEYLNYITEASALPQGFSTGSAVGSFIPEEAPGMGSLPIKATIIHLTDGPTDNWAAVFTQNKFPGSPIIVGRARLASGTPIQTIVINNKISNVCSGGDGVANAETVCKAVSDLLNLSGGVESVLPSSTGVIGWRLPAKELAEDVVPNAIKNLQSGSAFEAARDIMTTDRYPKLRSKTLSNGARITAIAKVNVIGQFQ